MTTATTIAAKVSKLTDEVVRVYYGRDNNGEYMNISLENNKAFTIYFG